MNTRFKQAREAAGLTQEKLAEIIGLSLQTVGAWERGERRPQIEALRAVAEACNTSVDYLLGLETEPVKIGDRLKELRKAARLSQAEVASKLFITQGAYGRYELGINEPSIESLNTLSVLYGTNVEYITGKSDISAQTEKLSDDEAELLSIFKSLDRRGRHLLMAYAYSLETGGDADAQA